MKDVETFKKMFKVRIPVDEHLAYYVRTLARSREHADLPDLVRAYEDLEAQGNPRELFYSTIERLRERLKGSSAYKRMLEVAVPPGIPERKLQAEPLVQYLLLDMRRANWSILKHFDTEGELPALWEELVGHPVLAMSKPLRQIVFGELSPKRVQALQRSVLFKLAQGLDNSRLEGSSHDELIYRVPTDNVGEALRRVGEEYPTVGFRVLTFRQERIAKDMHVRYLHEDGSYSHARLLGVPGDRYLPYFKSRVLGEYPSDPRDALFTHDGNVVQWRDLGSMKGLMPGSRA